jgi:hypothetical protein
MKGLNFASITEDLREIVVSYVFPLALQVPKTIPHHASPREASIRVTLIVVTYNFVEVHSVATTTAITLVLEHHESTAHLTITNGHHR